MAALAQEVGLNWRANLAEPGSGKRDEWVSRTILFWTDWLRVRLFAVIDGFPLSRKCSEVAAKTAPKTVMAAGSPISPILLLRVSSV
jgi:hypothetical protein